METIYDLSSLANGNVRISVRGKAATAQSLIRSLGQSEAQISEISSISKISRKEALKQARFQVFEAAMLGEDRLYRSAK